MLFPRPLHHTACVAALTLATALSASAQYAHLTLQSQPGDYIGLGQDYDLTYLPSTSDLFSAFAGSDFSISPNSPAFADFTFGQFNQTPDNFVSLDFDTIQLGIPLTPGTYTDAQSIASAGHPGLDVSFQHRGNNTSIGKFTITDFTYTVTASNSFVIDAFDATFEQHGEGHAAALFGQFSYRGAGDPPAPVPEAATTVSLGLLLALGLGGVAVAVRKKKALAQG